MDSLTLATTGRRIETVPRKAERPKTWPSGRVCRAAHTCPPGTRLSIYNPDDECHQCDVAATREERRVEREQPLAELMAQAPGPC